MAGCQIQQSMHHLGCWFNLSLILIIISILINWCYKIHHDVNILSFSLAGRARKLICRIGPMFFLCGFSENTFFDLDDPCDFSSVLIIILISYIIGFGSFHHFKMFFCLVIFLIGPRKHVRGLDCCYRFVDISGFSVNSSC